ncbi:MAG: hypothetical protein NW216_05060 [Hyphomicrobium sp.]|nr:hypothetical protein [Hyphomicrobium sp.]
MTETSTIDYAKGVDTAYQGEIYGEILYRSIADARTDAEEARKWRVLVELEKATRAHMEALVVKMGMSPAPDPYWTSRAFEDLPKYAPLAWPDLMRLFVEELDPVIAEYAALEAMAPPEHRAVLRLLTEHEVVTKAFCERELAGDGQRSLEPVMDFITRARARPLVATN